MDIQSRIKEIEEAQKRIKDTGLPLEERINIFKETVGRIEETRKYLETLELQVREILPSSGSTPSE